VRHAAAPAACYSLCLLNSLLPDTSAAVAATACVVVLQTASLLQHLLCCHVCQQHIASFPLRLFAAAATDLLCCRAQKATTQCCAVRCPQRVASVSLLTVAAAAATDLLCCRAQRATTQHRSAAL
jgi:hypothetical protein